MVEDQVLVLNDSFCKRGKSLSAASKRGKSLSAAQLSQLATVASNYEMWAPIPGQVTSDAYKVYDVLLCALNSLLDRAACVDTR